MNPDHHDHRGIIETTSERCSEVFVALCLLCWIVLSWIREKHAEQCERHRFVQATKGGHLVDIPLLPITLILKEMSEDAAYQANLSEKNGPQTPSNSHIEEAEGQGSG
ncbi:hypothetical protein DACRYDRAFT_24664 [Dacryopinax primogenitus]|uniref:Uncharacterized protein n=1 Tax=Dacryopinax primogenitus (strain DJM 731) TaxID=1858805 RepID=M5G332_DACPD|nr:uncharacterized protein DACRYDRAFT_24664 [Dacryopinax primogenitus]EJT98162.1 hypothetical protein DACRYDRAFT_24664 [Dacryopinax primogenitus]